MHLVQLMTHFKPHPQQESTLIFVSLITVRNSRQNGKEKNASFESDE